MIPLTLNGDAADKCELAARTVPLRTEFVVVRCFLEGKVSQRLSTEETS